MDQTHYSALGVAQDASPEEIRRAYRRLTRQFHPDVQRSGRRNEDLQKRLNKAWEVLRDPDRRRLYDAQMPNQPVEPSKEWSRPNSPPTSPPTYQRTYRARSRYSRYRSAHQTDRPYGEPRPPSEGWRPQSTKRPRGLYAQWIEGNAGAILWWVLVGIPLVGALLLAAFAIIYFLWPFCLVGAVWSFARWVCERKEPAPTRVCRIWLAGRGRAIADRLRHARPKGTAVADQARPSPRDE